MKLTVKGIAQGAILAAIYAVITILFTYNLSFEAAQFRVAEALTVLPIFSFNFVPGLFIGCLISNLLSPVGIMDIVFGSMATLISALLTYFIGKSNLKHKNILAPLPPVVINAIVVGCVLKFAYGIPLPLWLTMLQVGLGQALACYGLGLPLITFIEKSKSLKAIFASK